MSFNVQTKVTFKNAGGTEVKPAVVNDFSGLSDKELTHVGRQLTHVLLHLMDCSDDVADGKAPKGANANPLTMGFSYTVTQDGKPFYSMENTWANLGDEGQALIMGFFSGKMAEAKAGVGKGRGK